MPLYCPSFLAIAFRSSGNPSNREYTFFPRSSACAAARSTTGGTGVSQTPCAMLRPFAWTQAWVIARISEWANVAIRWLIYRVIVALLLDHGASLFAEPFQLGQALILCRPRRKRLGYDSGLHGF